MTNNLVENRTFNEISIGDRAQLVRTLLQQDIELFAAVSGDVNPAHLDAEYAAGNRFQKVVGHGMWAGALISTVLGTELPGAGTIYLGQQLQFRRPVGIGDTLTVTVTVTAKQNDRHVVVLDCCCTNQKGEKVVTGVAEVIAPTEKIRRPHIEIPEVSVAHRQRYRARLDAGAGGLGRDSAASPVQHRPPPIDQAATVSATPPLIASPLHSKNNPDGFNRSMQHVLFNQFEEEDCVCRARTGWMIGARP